MWRTKAFAICQYKNVRAWQHAIQNYMNKHVSSEIGYHISFDNSVLIVIHRLRITPSWSKNTKEPQKI